MYIYIRIQYTSSCLGWFVTGSIKKECHCPRAVVLPQVDEANLTELEEALEGWGSSATPGRRENHPESQNIP